MNQRPKDSDYEATRLRIESSGIDESSDSCLPDSGLHTKNLSVSENLKIDDTRSANVRANVTLTNLASVYLVCSLSYLFWYFVCWSVGLHESEKLFAALIVNSITASLSVSYKAIVGALLFVSINYWLGLSKKVFVVKYGVSISLFCTWLTAVLVEVCLNFLLVGAGISEVHIFLETCLKPALTFMGMIYLHGALIQYLFSQNLSKVGLFLLQNRKVQFVFLISFSISLVLHGFHDSSILTSRFFAELLFVFFVYAFPTGLTAAGLVLVMEMSGESPATKIDGRAEIK